MHKLYIFPFKPVTGKSTEWFLENKFHQQARKYVQITTQIFKWKIFVAAEPPIKCKAQ